MESPGRHLKSGMATYELTKTIEAVKLNKRTLRPLGPEHHTIPYGAVLENLIRERDLQRFYDLNEPYECAHGDIASALRELK